MHSLFLLSCKVSVPTVCQVCRCPSHYLPNGHGMNEKACRSCASVSLGLARPLPLQVRCGAHIAKLNRPLASANFGTLPFKRSAVFNSLTQTVLMLF
jgi:hypothetical protein